MLPFALTVGCSCNEFWYDSPKLLWIYANVYQRKQEHEIEMWKSKVSIEAWLTGNYIQMAIGSCLPGDMKYPEKPLEVFTIGESRSCQKTEAEKLEEHENQIKNQFLTIDATLK